MVMKANPTGWAIASAERSMRVARLAYASIIVLAVGYLGWAASGLPRLRLFDGASWMLASVLALFGLGFVRLQRERIALRVHPTSSWPAAVLTLLGLFTNALSAVLLAIGWFEVYQARSSFDLVPGRDRSAPAA